MELVADFAYTFPVIMIAELLGVPAEDRDQFKRWLDAIVETPPVGDEAAMEAHTPGADRAGPQRVFRGVDQSSPGQLSGRSGDSDQ